MKKIKLFTSGTEFIIQCDVDKWQNENYTNILDANFIFDHWNFPHLIVFYEDTPLTPNYENKS